MFLKLFLLVAVCSSLVATKNLQRRDADLGKLDDPNELRKDEKRDDDVAKKSAVENADQPPAATVIDGAYTEGAKDQTVDAGKTAAAPSKRLVAINGEDIAQCCG